jgi:membrane protease YdiL (CAAX protease family)
MFADFIRKEEIMATLRAFIKRYPVLTYFALVFAISWGGVLLVMGGLGRFPAPPEEITRLFPVAYLATVAGPSVASILLTGIVGGRTGFRQLFSRLLRWRVGLRWYAVALLTAPVSVIGTLLALSLLSSEFIPGFLTTSGGATPPGPLSMSLGVVIALSLFNGFVEELGWTGFAIPRMYRRYGVFVTGLSVGLLWGAWHFMSNLWLSGTPSGVPLALLMPVLLFSFLPPYRVLMTWVYDRTESLLVAALMHASLNAFWLSSTPPGITAMSLITWYLVWGAVLWVLAAVVVASSRHLARQLLHQEMSVARR